MAQLAISRVHEEVETACWAPWLRFSLGEMEAYEARFPEGQLLRTDDAGRPIGALTSIRVRWSGDPSDLGTWDGLAGRTESAQLAHDPEGNVLALLSIGVRPEHRGSGTARSLVRDAVERARQLGLEALIGPFRPSGFGPHVAATGDVDFVSYCRRTDRRGRLVDPWLRTMVDLGMVPLKVVDAAMVVTAGVDELDHHRATYRPRCWFRLTDPDTVAALLARHEHVVRGLPDEVWECGETGWWFVDRRRGLATYAEPNLWGAVAVQSGDDRA